VIQAVNRFMRNLRPQDRFALAAFDDSFDMLIRWRSVRDGDRQEIKLDSQGVADELKKVYGRKAVLVFTDGEDSVYPLHDTPNSYFEKVLRTVGESKVPFNFVGLIQQSTVEARLKRLADASGGQVFIASHIDEVIPLYDRISRELGASYTLGYLSDRPERDGSQRQIEIRTPAMADFRISQSRNHYTAH
jgi:hypothetical protein